MLTETMVKPSSWIDQEITMTPVKNCFLFKFSENLQNRLDELSEKKKQKPLSVEENAELAGILELNQIFTLLNAKIIGESP